MLLWFVWAANSKCDALEKVSLRASELISCEWCCVRKLPVLFFQTTPEECLRLRTQLNMTREKGGQWYDSAGGREYTYEPMLQWFLNPFHFNQPIIKGGFFPSRFLFC